MSRINFTQEQENKILELYSSGKSVTEVARIMGVSTTPIYRILNKFNVEIRGGKKGVNRKEVPQEHIDEIVYNYVNLGMGLLPSSKKFGYSQKKTASILKEAGVKLRTYVEAKDLTRKYTLDDDFFKHQSHNMAYVLGLLASDGNIAKNENGIFIELHEQDKQILEDIRKITNNSRPLAYYTHKHPNGTETPAVKFKAWSSAWKKDLAIYGIVPAKTLILEPPTFLAPEYHISYIKGYFDGDGCIHERQYGTGYAVEIVGASKKVIDWMRETLATNYGIIGGYSKTTANTGTPMYKISYNTLNSLLQLRKAWYENPLLTLSIERKKEKFYLIKEN